jgi:putative transposase
LVSLWRSTQHYTIKNPDKDQAIKVRMRGLVEKYRKWGCPLIHMVLKREGLVKNKKRTEKSQREVKVKKKFFMKKKVALVFKTKK